MLPDSFEHWKDAFVPSTWSNWALFAAAIWAGRMALNTLMAIRKQAQLMDAQIKLTEKTLVLQFRPRVILRAVTLFPTSTSKHGIADLQLWQIAIVLVNQGGNTAHVSTCGCNVYWRDNYPKPHKHNPAASERWTDLSLGPGEMRELVIQIQELDFSAAFAVSEHVTNKQETPYLWLICEGVITYHDDNGWTRQTGFKRQWNMETKRFEVSPDEETEYVD
jgi:hypothetical protein